MVRETRVGRLWVKIMVGKEKEDWVKIILREEIEGRLWVKIVVGEERKDSELRSW